MKLDTMIIICLLEGAALLPLAELVEVVDNGCGGVGGHAGERMSHRLVRPRLPSARCRYRRLASDRG
eukprot:973846-Ditylum_brightwellii.AAC.1